MFFNVFLFSLKGYYETLNKIGFNSKKFGLHSLREGGSTLAANLGVSDRLFQKYGQWKSERVKNEYVHQNMPVTSTSNYPVDTGRKLNVHKTFRRRPGRLLNVLCTFNLRPVSTR